MKKGQVAQLSNMAPFFLCVLTVLAALRGNLMACTETQHHERNIRCFGADYEDDPPQIRHVHDV